MYKIASKFSRNKRTLTLLSEYVAIFFILVVSAKSANFLSPTMFRWGLLFLSAVLFFRKFRRIDPVLIVIVISWVLINILSFIYNRTTFEFNLMRNIIITITTSYFLLKVSGPKTMERLEQIIFYLTIISLVLYPLLVFAPNLLLSFGKNINMFTKAEPLSYGGWYFFIYNFDGLNPVPRNSGFMWEPGAFAFMLILAIIYRFSMNGTRIDRRGLLYFIALATTISTMGYLVGFLLLIIFFIKRKAFIAIPALIILAAFILPRLLELDFIMPKFEQYFYQEGLDVVGRSSDISGGFLRVNRFGMMVIAFEQTLKWPLGYGMIPSRDMLDYYGEVLLGVGTIQYTLLRWGWIGLIFLFLSLYRFTSMFFIREQSFIKIIYVLAIVSALFTNPLENEPIFYSLIFYPYVFNRQFVQQKLIIKS